MALQNLNSSGKQSVLLWAFLGIYFASSLLVNLNPNPFFSAGIVLSAFVFAFVHGAIRYGLRGILIFLAICWGVSFALENTSILTGFPFGHYHYTDNIPGPRLYLVPLLIGLGYFSSGYVAWVLANILLDIADRRPDSHYSKFALPAIAAFIMVMWDVGMDPSNATIRKSWIWRDGGGYFGVPLSNYLGWYFTVWLFYQLFAFYLGKRQDPVNDIRYKTYWYQASILYLLIGMRQVYAYLLRSSIEVTDATGKVWSTGDIYESAVITFLFTMFFVCVLAFIKLPESNNAPAEQAAWTTSTLAARETETFTTTEPSGTRISFAEMKGQAERNPEVQRVPDTRALLWGILAPMLHRFRRGEGVLLAINASIILTQKASLQRMTMELLVSAIVLALLYAYNDVHDCKSDMDNPKKDRRLVLLLTAHRVQIIRVLVVLFTAVIMAAYLALGIISAVAVASVLLINVIYSHFLKRIVVIDVIWVGLCGAMYILTPGIELDFRVILLVWVMTSASHVFQSLGDRPVDRRNRIQTTAVFSPRLASALLFVFCAVAVWVIEHYFGLPLALTAFTPLVAHLAMDDVERAWLLSKVYFAILWLAVLFLNDLNLT